jgi:hypothetical protein
VSLAGLAVAIDFADIAYESGQLAQATGDYTKFGNLLDRMIREDCL